MKVETCPFDREKTEVYIFTPHTGKFILNLYLALS